MVENVGRKITIILSLVAVAMASLAISGFRLGLDLQGGTRLKYRLPFEQALEDGLITQEEFNDKPTLTRQMIGIIRERVDPSGVREPVIRAEGEDRIVIELPGTGAVVQENVEVGLATEVLAGASSAITLSGEEELLSAFPSTGGIIEIDNEKIHYKKRSGNLLTGITRKYSGTDAATHAGGATVRLINSDPWRALIENVGDLALLHRGQVDRLPIAGHRPHVRAEQAQGVDRRQPR